MAARIIILTKLHGGEWSALRSGRLPLRKVSTVPNSKIIRL